MKDSTILIIFGSIAAIILGAIYLVYMAWKKAKEEAEKKVANATCAATSVPGNFLNGLSWALAGKKVAGDTCTDKQNANTYSSVPSCPSGQYWNGNEQKCMANETAIRPANPNPALGGVLANNPNAPLTADTNPWGYDTIITHPDGSTMEVHPVTAPIGYKVVYTVTSDGSEPRCPDGSTPKVDPANGQKYCVVPEYAAIRNPALDTGLPGNPGNTAPATTSQKTVSILGFKLPDLTAGRTINNDVAW